MTPDLEEEWDRHQSYFASEWRVAMETEGLVYAVSPVADGDLRRGMLSTAQSKNNRLALEKDLHLIEAARATDHTVSSLDEQVRGLLREAARVIEGIRAIVWVNPTKTTEETPIPWLQDGAPAEPQRMLGYRLPVTPH